MRYWRLCCGKRSHMPDKDPQVEFRSPEAKEKLRHKIDINIVLNILRSYLHVRVHFTEEEE